MKIATIKKILGLLIILTAPINDVLAFKNALEMEESQKSQIPTQQTSSSDQITKTEQPQNPAPSLSWWQKLAAQFSESAQNAFSQAKGKLFKGVVYTQDQFTAFISQAKNWSWKTVTNVLKALLGTHDIATIKLYRGDGTEITTLSNTVPFKKEIPDKQKNTNNDPILSPEVDRMLNGIAQNEMNSSYAFIKNRLEV